MIKKVMKVYLQKSDKSDKKWMVTIENKTIHFGAKGMSDFTKHKDEERKERYIKRHSGMNQNWKKSGIKTAGFWSRWLTWNKPTLKASIDDIEKKFNLKIIRGKPPEHSLKYLYSKPKPKDKALYNKVVAEAKKKFKVWPSAYASGWVTRTYKARGGKYDGEKPSKSGLSRWYKEKWVDVCYWPKRKSCGRKKSSPKKYPYCRPSVRVTSKTPKTVQELTEKERKKLCKSKRRSPSKRSRSLSFKNYM